MGKEVQLIANNEISVYLGISIVQAFPNPPFYGYVMGCLNDKSIK